MGGVRSVSQKRGIRRKGSRVSPGKIYRRDNMHWYFIKGMHLSSASMAWLVPHRTSFAEHPQFESIGKLRRLPQPGDCPGEFQTPFARKGG